MLSDVLDDESTLKGVLEEDTFDFDFGCGGGDGDCGEASEANEVEKRREAVVAIVGVVLSTIGSNPPPEMDTNGDIFRERSV